MPDQASLPSGATKNTGGAHTAEAAAINRIVTVAKIVPILFFVVLALFYFEPSVFADNFGAVELPMLGSALPLPVVVNWNWKDRFSGAEPAVR